MSNYSLVGNLKAKPGQGEALVEALLEASQIIKDADGLRSWIVHSDSKDADRVWITEVWESQEHHAASLETPGVREHIQATMALLEEPPVPGTSLTPRGGVGLEGTATASGARFNWNELAAKDVSKAKAFYAEVFGWSFEKFDLPDGEYWLANTKSGPVGGIASIDTIAPGTKHANWYSYVEVEDVDACVQRARQSGAQVPMEPQDVPNVGRVAMLQDPDGATIGILAPEEPSTP